MKSEALIARLLKRTTKTTTCWNWNGSKSGGGYGSININKKSRLVHRVSFEAHNLINIPPKMVIMHSCDNRVCINPKHLSMGTQSDNVQDCLRKGRWNSPVTNRKKQGLCKRGHDITKSENVFIYKTKNNIEVCRLCIRFLQKERRMKLSPEKKQKRLDDLSEWRKNNPQRILEYDRKRRKKDREKIRLQQIERRKRKIEN